MEARRLGKMGVGSEDDLGVESSVKRAAERSSRDRNDGCYYTTLFNSVCSLDKDASGKPVQICEKTEKLLRTCVGRPQEIVESRTEKTIEDASTSSSAYLTDKDLRANRGWQPQWADKYREDRLRAREESSFMRDLFEKDSTLREREEGVTPEFFERKMETYAGTFDELVKAAEDMVQEVFGPLGLAEDVLPRQPADSKVERPSSSFWGALLGRDRKEMPNRKETNSQQLQPQKPPADYSGLVKNIQEV